MKNRLLLRIFVFALFCGSLFAYPEPGRYLSSKGFDVTKAIPAAPAADSLTTLADLETVYQVQQRRSPEQVLVAQQFAEASLFKFDAVLGPWFTAANLPRLDEFFQQIDSDRYAISSQGKQAWNRLRPPLVDPRIHASIALSKSGSYPSGHATQAFVWAGLLGEIFPEDRTALRAYADLIAWSRIVGAVHYPSDVVAGRMLGDRLVQEFLKVPAVRETITTLAAEAAPLRAKELAHTTP